MEQVTKQKEETPPKKQSAQVLQENELAETLAKQEAMRMIYWKECDTFIDLRMKWRASMVRHLFHILPGQKILEIGAGDGTFTKAIDKATRGECSITSVVFSDELEQEIKREVPSENVHVKRLESFPSNLSEDQFDVVIAHHMLEDYSRNTFLHKIKSLVRPGGGLILFEPNPWNPYYRIRRFVQKVLPLNWRRPKEPVSLDRLQIFYTLSEIGYTQINALPYDFLYAPIPRFLLWPAKHLSLIFENAPIFRNMAGSLYIWARKPQEKDEQSPRADLAEHSMFNEKVSFIAPCHNEEMNVKPLVENIKAFYGKYIAEIIIVDDNSTDNTANVAEALAKEDERIRVIRRTPPNGVGFAIRDGLKASQSEYVMTMDSDFQHIIPEMRDLFDAIVEGADVAVGSRFSRESVLVNYPFTKILANRSFHVVANLLLWKHFRDISNNLKIFKREVVDNLEIESQDFAVNIETGLKPILLGYKVTEVPISWVNRSATMGLSTFKIIKVGPNYFTLLFKFAFRKLTGKFKRNESASTK